MDPWTAPFAPYQADDLAATQDAKTYAYFWEQGLGKSWLTINVARHNWEQGRIDALLITAPNGVHANWIHDELPKHLPPTLPWEGMVWWPSVATGHWSDVGPNLRAFVNQRDKLVVLATSYHALLHPRSFQVIRQFLAERKVLWVLDESDDIGSPGATWTKRILRLAPNATMRRIATGTPYKDGTPLAYWSQFNFLHPDIIGIPTYRAFKLRYAEWFFRPLPGRPYDAMLPVKDPLTGRQRFRNLDELEAKIAVRSVRRTKAAELPNLPPKLYDKVWFELSKTQEQIYRRLEEESLFELANGEVRSIELAMTLRLRLQQVASGFYPTHGEEPERPIRGGNPRLDETVANVNRSTSQVIVWARFRMDIDMLMAELGSAARYDGSVNEADRVRARADFTSGAVQVLVANQAALSRGWTFTNAHRAIFYTNYPNLLLRTQAEDRQHRIGTTNAVLYTDVLGRATVDEVTVAALRAKMGVADFLMNRPVSEWL